MSTNHGWLEFDGSKLAEAWHLSIDDIVEAYRDARISHLMVTIHLCRLMNGKMAPRDQGGWDFLDESGGRWEARCIANSGLSFTPSSQRGKGRVFDVGEFYEILEQLEGFAVADIVAFPRVEYWFVPAHLVRGWYESGQLSKQGQLSYRQARAALGHLALGSTPTQMSL